MEDMSQIRDASITDNDEKELLISRKLNQEKATKLIETEQQRRIQEQKNFEKREKEERSENINKSIDLAETERQRRIKEHQDIQLAQDTIQHQNRKEVVVLAEQERLRRIMENEKHSKEELNERVQRMHLAISLSEAERISRLQSKEHADKMSRFVNHFDKVPEGNELINEMNDFGKKATNTGSISNTLNVKKLDKIDSTLEMSPSSSSLKVDSTIKTETNEEMNDIILESMIHYENKDGTMVPTKPAVQRLFLSNKRTIESTKPDEESNALMKMREALSEDLKNTCDFSEVIGDVRLLRYLRGHQLNVEISVGKYRKMLQWRKGNDLDKIRQDIVTNQLTVEQFPYYNKIIKYIPFTDAYDVTDEYGNILIFERTGYIDIYGLLQHVSEKEWNTFCFYQLEKRSIILDELSMKNKKMIKMISIRDLNGLSIVHNSAAGLKRLKDTVVMGSEYYPESMEKLLLLNVPWIFHSVWKIIRLWLNEHQQKKFQIIKKEDLYLVYNTISQENLPPLLGGTNVSFVVHETGLLSKSSYDSLVEIGGTEMEIHPGGQLQVPFNINKDDTLCWEFDIKSHDIEFGIKFRTQDYGGATEIFLNEKKQISSGKLQNGTFTATESGTIVLLWDNASSWTRKKKIVYKTKMIRPIINNDTEGETIDCSSTSCLPIKEL